MCSSLQTIKNMEVVLLAARWHYFTFQDTWIQADAANLRDHLLTNQRRSCTPQPLTTPKCPFSLYPSLSHSPRPLCTFLLLFHFRSLSSFTQPKPALLLCLGPILFRLAHFTRSARHSPFLPFHFLLPCLHFHPLPLHPSPLTFSFSFLPNSTAETRVAFLCYTPS